VLGPWRKDPVACRLRAIRFRQSLFRVCALLLAGVGACVFYAVLEMLVDRRWELLAATRQASLVVALSLIVGAAAVAGVRLLLRQTNLLFQARAVDRALGFEDDALVTYVDLRRGRVLTGPEAEVARHLQVLAAERAQAVEADQVVDIRPVAWAGWALGGGLVVLLALYLLWGRSFADTFYRCVMPWRQIAPPRATRIVDVRPGNGIAVAGEPVRFVIGVQGDVLPPEAALVRQADGETSQVQESLARAAGDDSDLPGPRISGDAVYRKEIPGLVRPTTYWVSCNDAARGPFHLDVVERPLVTAVNVRVLPPDYAPFAPVRDVAGGHVQAIIGSRLEIAATVTQTPRQPRAGSEADTAWLLAGTARQPMAVSGRTLNASVTVQRDFEYRIGYVDNHDLASREGLLYQVKALPDRPPTAALHRDGIPDGTPAGATDTIVLRGEATDDLGVGKLFLRLRADGLPGLARTIPCPPAVPAASVARSITVDLRPFGLREGQTLECVLVAEDVRKPAGQRTESAPLRIPITRPAEQPAVAIANVRKPADEPDDEMRVARRTLTRPSKPQPEPEERATEPEERWREVERLSKHEEELLRKLSELTEKQLTDEEKKQLSELADEQEKIADELVKTMEEQSDVAQSSGLRRDTTPQNEEGNGTKPGGAQMERQDGQQNGEGAGEASRQGDSANPRLQPGGKGDGRAEGQGKEQGQKQGQGEGQGQGQGQGQKQGQGEGQGQGQGQGQKQGQGEGQGEGQGKGKGESANGGASKPGGGGKNSASGASTSPASSVADAAARDAQEARRDLAETAKKLREGEVSQELVGKAKSAFDRLFRAGRSFTKADREKLAAKNATLSPAGRGQGEGAAKTPDGRVNKNVTGDGRAPGSVTNAPGELKEDPLGQPTTKGQVRIAPEYRKALEDYYKSIAK
jgi:hypothetical protein